MAIALRFAARSDVGLVRSNNQDSGYAGPHLLVIADGMGGHAGGDVASSLAIGELAPLDGESHGADAMNHLSEAVYAAHRELLGRVAEEPALSGMGTTVTALLRTGTRFALAHIGDSRAYLLRDGELVQITRDHTFVQRLVDDGKLTLEEAEQHPQRSVLMRVLSDIVDDIEPDLSMREARIGDRYLLCSDGLSSVVSFDTIRETMAGGREPTATCEKLVQLALRSGAPDNVTCIVADVVDTSGAPPDSVPVVVGAASVNRRQVRSTPPTSAAERAAQLTARPSARSDTDDEEPSRGGSGRRLRYSIAFAVLLVLLAGGGYGAWRWSQGQFYVGADGGAVAIFRGLPQDLGPVKLSSVDEVVADIRVSDLPSYFRDQVDRGIVATDESEARRVVAQLRSQAAQCKAAQAAARARAAATPTPSAAAVRPSAGVPTQTPTPAATARPLPTPTASPGAADCSGIG